MTDKPDNQPAFPCDMYSEPYKQGMTLRDYFAGQALAGALANSHPKVVDAFAKHSTHSDVAFAESAYLFADAMLKARDNDK